MKRYSLVIQITKPDILDLLVLLDSLYVGIDMDFTFIYCLIDPCMRMLDAHFTAVVFNIDRRLGITLTLRVFRLCLLLTTYHIFFGSTKKSHVC